MVAALLISPAVFALLALLVPSDRVRPWLVPAGAAVQLGLVAWTFAHPLAPALGGWIVLDSLGKVMLGFITTLFFLAAVYVPGYLPLRPDRPNRVFTACILGILGSMTLVTLSHHLGLMWVALETTTLCTAPLIFFNRNARSLEAVWKYLMVGSVGVALALLGSLFLAYSALHARLEPSLLLEDVVAQAPHLSRPWLHAAFVLLFIGYGTKMGLAPMHSWKPDAYGEAPGVVGALLAGGFTACAFLSLLRFFHIMSAAGEAAFARHLMLGAGLFSMGVAGVFMIRQRDYKRLLAYSSVEHMGIMAVGIGLGGGAVFGSLLHVVNNGLTKLVLFLSVGNIHRAFGSKRLEQTQGAIRVVPFSGILLVLGFLAVTGSPPFGPFLSEFTIFDAAVTSGHGWVAGLFLAALAVVFLGMSATILQVVQGKPTGAPVPAGYGYKDRLLTVAPAVVALALVLMLGVYLPHPLEMLLREAATLEVGP